MDVQLEKMVAMVEVELCADFIVSAPVNLVGGDGARRSKKSAAVMARRNQFLCTSLST